MSTTNLAIRIILGSTLYLLTSCKSDNLSAASTFSQGLARVSKNGKKSGFINERGEWAIPPRFDLVEDYSPHRLGSIEDFNGGVAVVLVGKKWGLVHESGEIRTPPQFDRIESMSKNPPHIFYNGLAKVSIDGKFGLIDEMGKFIIPPKFEEVYPFDFDPEISVGKLAGKWSHIDRQGNIIFPVYGDLAFNHNTFDRRFGSLAMVEIKNKYGFIDRHGKLVVPPKYDEIINDTPNNGYGIESYYDSLRKEKIAQARIGNKWGYINTQGAIQIPMKFDNAGSFKYGVAEVTIGKRILYIDKQGKTFPF